jgi:hypothetical protein
MATLREAFKARLADDPTLAGLLYGGVLDADDVFRGLKVTNVPYESNGVTIQPFASIRWGGANPFGPVTVQAEQQRVEVYVYQHTGYATIEAALTRIKQLCNRQFISADDRQLAYLANPQKGPDSNEEALGWACGRFIRFSITQIDG